MVILHFRKFLSIERETKVLVQSTPTFSYLAFDLHHKLFCMCINSTIAMADLGFVNRGRGLNNTLRQGFEAFYVTFMGYFRYALNMIKSIYTKILMHLCMYVKSYSFSIVLLFFLYWVTKKGPTPFKSATDKWYIHRWPFIRTGTSVSPSLKLFQLDERSNDNANFLVYLFKLSIYV